MADEDPRLSQLQRLSAMRDEYLSLAPVIKKLELATTEPTLTKVPLGSKCFAFGSIPPSARITVAVGDDFFIECSAGGALGMIDRRLTIINTNITNLAKVLDSEDEATAPPTSASPSTPISTATTPLSKSEPAPRTPPTTSRDSSSDSPLGQVVQRPDGFFDIIEPYEEPSPPPTKVQPAALAQAPSQSHGRVSSPTAPKSSGDTLPSIFSSARASTESTSPSSTAKEVSASSPEPQPESTLSIPTLSAAAPTDSDRDVITMNNLTTSLPTNGSTTAPAAAPVAPAAEAAPPVQAKKMSKFKMRQLGLL